MKAIYCSSVLALVMLLGGGCQTNNSSIATGLAENFEGPVGLQLYSLRGEFASQGVPQTLDTVKGYGLQYVELAGTYNLSEARFSEMLAERNLKAISGHFSYDLYKSDPEAVAKQAKALGLKYAGCAWISHKFGEFNEENAKDAIEVFNKAGAVLKEHGIQFFYHCHGYEFAQHGDGTYMDMIIRGTDPKNVAFQMDIYWVVHPGQDPVEWFNKYGSRWQLVHLKDMRKGVEGDLTGRSDVENDVVLGTGQMDWPAILAAAKKAGVKYYFIEDESPWAKTQIPASLDYLEKVEF